MDIQSTLPVCSNSQSRNSFIAGLMALDRQRGQRAPILVPVYLTESTASMEARNATISSVGAAIAASS